MMNSITEIRKKIAERKVSVVEIVNEYLQKIKTQNDKLNVFLTVTAEEALKRAAKLDEQIAKDDEVLKRKPLLGIPVAHKDIFMTKDVRTTAGSKVLEKYIPPYSATVVEKLDDAGMVMLGKLNCDAWAHGASGENSDYGPTLNPVNNEYVPGGSSSGSAAAVAAEMVPVATGSDTGGSIRLPANFCGVVGFKPTYGRVSRYGVIAMASSLDSIGHITNSVEDAADILAITAGEDRLDANTTGMKPYEKRLGQIKMKGLKIGVPKEYFEPIKDDEIKTNFNKLKSVVSKAGAEIIDISLPNTEAAISVYYIVMPAEVSSNLARFDGIRYGNTRDSFGAEAKRRIMMGTYELSEGYVDAYYKTALKVRTMIKLDFDRAFNEVDVIIAPVSPTPPFKIGEKVDDPLDMYLSDVLTVSPSLAGIPGLSLPTGKTSNGLPLGVQILAKRNDEETMLDVGYQIEQVLK